MHESIFPLRSIFYFLFVPTKYLTVPMFLLIAGKNKKKAVFNVEYRPNAMLLNEAKLFRNLNATFFPFWNLLEQTDID